MNQPEFGIKIRELRIQKGHTQQQLADLCAVDIRTIQRIETGNAAPRMSTLKILSEILELDNTDNSKAMSNETLLFTLIIGILYLFLSLFQTGFIKLSHTAGINLSIPLLIFYMISGALFYFGFYKLSKHQENKLLKYTSLATVVTISIFSLLNIIKISSPQLVTLPMFYISLLILTINSILFSIGLLQAKGNFKLLSQIAGIIQLIMSPMFIIRINIVNMVGLRLSLLYTLLLLLLVYSEFRYYSRANG